MEEHNYTVYMHICPNGKKYIGITKQLPEKRWKKGDGYRTQKYFKRAIQKYSWNNIQHIILFKNLTKEEACNKEIELIKKYRTNNYKYGYNVSSGGDGANGVIISERQKEILRKALKGNKNAKGYKHTKEECKKMKLAKLGKPNIKLSKRVLCIETNKEYPSVAEARRQTKVNHIDQVCRGERNYAGMIDNVKLHWKYI
ncbi:MAG: GIY-YIG nuclease family protein [Clostridia bacterium]|nr:GIY-YIG nuclease family protein [Clostridia bacterium]